MRNIRIGLGFDVHSFEQSGSSLVLGGINIDYKCSLKGHSDADVITHAIAEALLGSIGLGGLGEHFPDTDPRWKNVESLKILSLTVEKLRELNWNTINVDCSVVLEEPHLATFRQQMQDRLSFIIGAPINIKAKRPEGLGSLGRSEGIACWAIALVGME